MGFVLANAEATHDVGDGDVQHRRRHHRSHHAEDNRRGCQPLVVGHMRKLFWYGRCDGGHVGLFVSQGVSVANFRQRNRHFVAMR